MTPEQQILWALACGDTARAIALREAQDIATTDGRTLAGWKKRELRKVKEKKARAR